MVLKLLMIKWSAPQFQIKSLTGFSEDRAFVKMLR